jgi:hypothetical protein
MHSSSCQLLLFLSILKRIVFLEHTHMQCRTQVYPLLRWTGEKKITKRFNKVWTILGLSADDFGPQPNLHTGL